MLIETDIRKYCTNQSFSRGMQLWRGGSVLDLEMGDDDGFKYSIHATVEGSTGNVYAVSFTANALKETLRDFSCTCPAFTDTYRGVPCKHCVAAYLEFLKKMDPPERPSKNPQPGVSSNHHQQDAVEKLLAAIGTDKINKGITRASTPVQHYPIKTPTVKVSAKIPARSSAEIIDLLYSYASADGDAFSIGEPEGDIELEVSLRDTIYHGWQLGLRVGKERKYVVRSIDDFLGAVHDRQHVIYGKSLAFVHDPRAFTPRAKQLITLLSKIGTTRTKTLETVDRWYYPNVIGRYLTLSAFDLADILDVFIGDEIPFENSGGQHLKLQVVDGDPTFRLTLRQQDPTTYTLELPGNITCIDADRLYIRVRGTVYRCSTSFKEEMSTFCKTIADDRVPRSLTILEKDMPGFCTALLPTLEKYTSIDLPDSLDRFAPDPPHFMFYLDKVDQLVTCTSKVSYGTLLFDLTARVPQSQLFRNLFLERDALNTVYRFFYPNVDPDIPTCFPYDDDDALYALLTSGTEALARYGDVFVSDVLKRITVRPTPAIVVGVSVRSELLDITVSSTGMSLSEMGTYLDSFRRKRHFFRLKNGDMIKMEESGLGAVTDLMDGLGVRVEDFADGTLAVPSYRSFFLNQTLKDADGVRYDRDTSFRALLRDLDSMENSDFSAPEALQGVLRSYQVTGFRWLKTLEKLRFGGILADEMGLGKTIQVIAFLASHHMPAPDAPNGGAALDGSANIPSLIVCPASLIYNWQAEFARFAPDLNVRAVVGTQPERAETIEHSSRYDVLITSYDLIKRDVANYKKQHFYCEVIDEAQYIKNQNTKSARAVKAVSSQVRFALTGTPIENRLSELWSIFDYLMPGFLGSYKQFKENYEAPIATGTDSSAASRLQRMITPFVLRRLKRDVLKDLPDKTENVVYSCMEGEQAKLYNASAVRLKLALEKQAPDEFSTGKIAILAELTKLRQLCCDPHLLYENFEGSSAKLDTCLELIDNALDGGHKVLVFSQFTTMLDIVANKLDGKHIAFHKLTGATPKEKRAHLVSSFGRDDVPVFLISLKAGGTGLNLTAANIVIHLDPWWNIAAQDQATDRTHRIGQSKDVSVFKLIAKDTVEENILKMQESKRDLAEQILGKEGMGVASLTKDDLLALLKSDE